ncbi:MAG: hypothetical protein ACYC4S_12900 [Rhodoferax sp.]
MATTTEKTINASTPSATQAPVLAAPVTSAKAPVKAARKTVAKKPAAPAKVPVKPAVKAALKPSVKPAIKAAFKPVLKTAVKTVRKPVTEPKTDKNNKDKKPKLVRDSFTIPKAEYTVLDELKLRSGKLLASAKKSEFIRAGIKALAAMSDTAFLAALKAVPAIKTGRPKK